MYKSCPELYIPDWLSHHNHAVNKDQEISGMSISIDTINKPVDIPICTSTEDAKAATKEDVALQMLEKHVIKGWLHIKERTEPGLNTGQ